jgi:hypothetical protein
MICAAVERCAGIEVGKTFLAVFAMTGPEAGRRDACRDGIHGLVGARSNLRMVEKVEKKRASLRQVGQV